MKLSGSFSVSLNQLYFTSFIHSNSLEQNVLYPNCPDFIYKWSWGFCVMQMQCCEHKREEYKQLTPLATYLVSLYQLNFTSLVYSYSLVQNLAIPPLPRPDFLNKWSWGSCVMQMHFCEHKREEYKQLTPLATYLVSLNQINFSSFVYSYSLVQNLAITPLPRPDFLYKWSWGSCVMQMHCSEHKREEYKQLSPLATYLVSLN